MKNGFIPVALAIMVLAGVMAGPSLAENEGNTDWARFAETNPEAYIDPEHIRGQVETGALPDARGASSDAMSDDSGVRNRAGLEGP